MSTVGIQELLEELDDKGRVRDFRFISKDKATDAFSKMNSSIKA